MISLITATGNLGGKPRVINGQKKNFLAFSLAVREGKNTTWFDCTWSFNGNQPPKVLDYLETGKTVAIQARPYAKLMPAKDDYPAKAVLCLGIVELELIGGHNREIHGSQEQPAPEGETAPGEDGSDGTDNQPH